MHTKPLHTAHEGRFPNQKGADYERGCWRRLMTIADLSTMLGAPIDTLYGWRHRGEGPRATASAATFAIAAPASRPGWRSRPTAGSPHGNRRMAHIERRRIRQPDAAGRGRVVTRYRVRYRAESGRQHCETKMRLVDALRRKAEIELALAGGTWHHPCRAKCVYMSGLSCGCPRDMIFERQHGLGPRPQCRSRSCRASATRRLGAGRAPPGQPAEPYSLRPLNRATQRPQGPVQVHQRKRLACRGPISQCSVVVADRYT
jgi:hypothetical protein